MIPFHEILDFLCSRNMSTIILTSHFTDLTLYARQKLDKQLATLHSSDPDFFPLQRPANLPEKHTIPNSHTNQVNTLYPKIRIKFFTLPLYVHQSFPVHIPVSSIKIPPRLQHCLFLTHLQDYLPHKYPQARHLKVHKLKVVHLNLKYL